MPGTQSLGTLIRPGFNRVFADFRKESVLAIQSEFTMRKAPCISFSSLAIELL